MNEAYPHWKETYPGLIGRKWLLTLLLAPRSSLPSHPTLGWLQGASAVGFQQRPFVFAHYLSTPSKCTRSVSLSLSSLPFSLPHSPSLSCPSLPPAPNVIFWSTENILMEVFVFVCHPVTWDCSLFLGDLPVCSVPHHGCRPSSCVWVSGVFTETSMPFAPSLCS